jgi:putative methionine-R-sulfoxide reductase with GAF domain/two-component sensor histidine kinase
MKDGRLLFSTNDGVYSAHYNGENIIVKKYTEHFNNVYVNILVEDKQGIIWAASDNGIYRYDPVEDRVNLFDYTDNVQGFGFSANSWFLNQEDGLLFLGGINGINYFRPDGIHVLNSSLNLFIQRVIGGQKDSIIFDLHRKAILPWEQRALEISFVCPYYSNPGKLKFRYKLEGSDEGWKNIGNNNHLRFASLSPGDYTLYLEASINGADWVPSKNTFSFRIKPPFWLSWWFITLAFVSIITGVWRIIRSRNQQIEEQREELEAEQAINYFSTRMADNLTIDDLLWDIAGNCIGRLHFEDCVIYLINESGDALVQKAAYGPKSPVRAEIINPIQIKIGNGVTGTVARTGKAELIHDTSKDPRYIVDDVRRYSEIAVPIISNGKVLGVIDCEHSRKRFFTQRHLSILTTIASLCAVRMMKAKTEAEKSETERILMETKQQMADIEMQALRAQMNPHFIFNCLNSINRYIVKSDQVTASLYLTRFAKLIRLILDNSNSKTVALTNELEALHLYIEMESIRFEKQFTYTINVDENVHPDHVYVPPLIIQPYVENAIWHGLLHKDQSGQLKIHVRMKGAGLLECLVEDNGVGREKAKELKSKSASTSKSLGMKLTESRLAILNQHSNWGASVEVIDLKTADGEASGTRVILRMAVDA